MNWDGGGQFDFIRADGVGAYARFVWEGVRYFCDWDSYNGTCGGEDGYDFNYDYEYLGTFQEVPEPRLPVLLGVGLFGLIALRRRVLTNMQGELASSFSTRPGTFASHGINDARSSVEPEYQSWWRPVGVTRDS